MADGADQQKLKDLKQIIDEHAGPTSVVLVLGPNDAKQIIKLPAGIANTEPVLEKLRAVAGAENIKLG